MAAALATLMAAVLLAAAAPALAQTVALTGQMGQRALLVVDGKPPRSVAPGESHMGVKVLSVGDGQAMVEIGGKRHSLRLGDAPVSIGTERDAGSGSRIVLAAGSGGHFVTSGQINGRQARLLVDTGASLVVISADQATQLGLDYRRAQPVRMGTANGSVLAWPMRLESIRIGDVTVFGVDGLVSPEPMPYVLLGNSFLSRFQMTRENDQLLLSRRF